MAYNIEMGWKGSALVRGLKNAGTLWHHVARMQKGAVVEAVKYNRSGELLKITLGKLDNVGHKVISTYSKFNHIVGTKTRSTVALTSRSIEMQGRSFNKVTKSIGAMSAAIRRSAVAEGIHKNNLALNKHLASIQTWLSSNNKAGIAANRMWKELAVGNIMQYTGKLLTLQNRLRAIINLRSKLAAQARSAGSMGGKPSGAATGGRPSDVAIGTELRENEIRRTQAAIDKLANSFRKLGASTTQLVTAEGIFKRLTATAGKHGIQVKTLERMWKQVSSGEIRNYRGAMRDIQTEMLKMHGLQQKVAANHRASAAAAKKAAAAMRKTAEATKRIKDNSRSMVISWTSVARLVISASIHRMFFNIAGSIRQATTNAIDFSIALAEVRTIDSARMETNKLSDALIKLSDSYSIDVLEQAEAMYQTLSNQVADGAEAIMFLDSANRLAKATVSQTSDAVNVLTSAINAWGLRTTEAERLNAMFFKTIELGRLRLEEMGQVFGRVALPAAQLGVTVSELLAMLTVTTIKGVKLSEAMTFVRNIFQKLIRPTEEMKKLFREWGVVSGEAAIKAFGIAGVMAKIEERTKGSSSEIGKLMGRIRAIAGQMVFAGKGVQQFKDAWDEIVSAGPTYIRAIDEVMTSVGKQIRLELTQVRNVFLKDFAQPLIEKIAIINKTIIDFSDTVKLLRPTLKNLVLPLGSLGAALMVFGLAAGGIAAVSVGITGIVAAIGVFSVARANLQVAEKRLRESFETNLAQQLDMAARRDIERMEKRLTAMDLVFKKLTSGIASVSIVITKETIKLSERIFSSLQEKNEDVVRMIKELKSEYSKTVQEAKKNLSTINSLTKSMEKSILSLKDASDNMSFDAAMKSADTLGKKLRLLHEEDIKLFLGREHLISKGAPFKEIESFSKKIAAIHLEQGKLINSAAKANKELIKELVQVSKNLKSEKQQLLFDINFDDADTLADKLQVIRNEVSALNKEAAVQGKIVFDDEADLGSRDRAGKSYVEIGKRILELGMLARELSEQTSKSNKDIAKEKRDLDRDALLQEGEDNQVREEFARKLAKINKDLKGTERKEKIADLAREEKNFEEDVKIRKNTLAQARHDIKPIQIVPPLNDVRGHVKSIYALFQKAQEELQKAASQNTKIIEIAQDELHAKLQQELELRMRLIKAIEGQAEAMKKSLLEVEGKKIDMQIFSKSMLDFKSKDILDAGSVKEIDKLLNDYFGDVERFITFRQGIDPDFTGIGLREIFSQSDRLGEAQKIILDQNKRDTEAQQKITGGKGAVKQLLDEESRLEGAIGDKNSMKAIIKRLQSLQEVTLRTLTGGEMGTSQLRTIIREFQKWQSGEYEGPRDPALRNLIKRLSGSSPSMLKTIRSALEDSVKQGRRQVGWKESFHRGMPWGNFYETGFYGANYSGVGADPRAGMGRGRVESQMQGVEFFAGEEGKGLFVRFLDLLKQQDELRNVRNELDRVGRILGEDEMKKLTAELNEGNFNMKEVKAAIDKLGIATNDLRGTIENMPEISQTTFKLVIVDKNGKNTEVTDDNAVSLAEKINHAQNQGITE